MNGYDADGIVQKVIEDPARMLPLMALAMGFGFIQYIYGAVMDRRDKRSPFPAYMHAYYLAHDNMFVLLFHKWFVQYDSWAFQAMWVGMLIFNVMEIFYLYRVVRYGRQHEFGRYYDGRVTVRQATIRVIVMVLVSYVILFTARSFLNDQIMFCIFVSTNIMMAIGPAMHSQETRRRVRGSVGLAFFIVCGTIATFAPEGFGLYTTGDPEYFARPWFFIMGATCLAVAVWHLVYVLRLPLRPYTPEEIADNTAPTEKKSPVLTA